MNKIEQEIVIKMEPEIHKEEEHLAVSQGVASHRYRQRPLKEEL